MSATIYGVRYATKLGSVKLREVLDRHCNGNIYTDEGAQSMVDDIDAIGGWDDVKDDNDRNSVMIWSMDDNPSPISYNGGEYNFYLIWDEEEDVPAFMVLAEK